MTSDPPLPEDEDADPNLDMDVDVEALLPPWSIWYAVRLMWAGAVLSLVALAVTLLTADSIKRTIADHLREQNKYTQHTVDTQYQNLIASTVAARLARCVVVWLWMARANGAGQEMGTALRHRPGARRTSSASWSRSRPTGSPCRRSCSAGLNVLLAAAVLVLLWHPDSSDYYWFKSKRT